MICYIEIPFKTILTVYVVTVIIEKKQVLHSRNKMKKKIYYTVRTKWKKNRLSEQN